VYNNTPGAVKAGEMFPIDGVMHVVVQREASDIVTVSNNITNAIIQMSKQIVIAILNNSSNT
jgi:hydrogenase maturation factor HypF (carbamoyltransferase family)